MNKYRVEYCEENGFTKIYPETTEIKGYVKYLEDKLNKTEAELKLLNLRFVSKLAKLMQFVQKQENIPAEFNDIVNDNFWDLI